MLRLAACQRCKGALSWDSRDRCWCCLSCGATQYAEPPLPYVAPGRKAKHG